MREKPPEDQLAELEALLFIHGEPLSTKKIAAVLGISEEAAALLLKNFEEKLYASERGLMLVSREGKAQLATKPRFHELVARFVKEELSEELTPASLEALSLIAYFGPMSRSRLEYLRGVNSSFILRNLMLRGLIERAPAPPESDAQGYLYLPSFTLMKHLGLGKKEDLPEFEKFHEIIKSYEGRGEMLAGSNPTHAEEF